MLCWPLQNIAKQVYNSMYRRHDMIHDLPGINSYSVDQNEQIAHVLTMLTHAFLHTLSSHDSCKLNRSLYARRLKH